MSKFDRSTHEPGRLSKKVLEWLKSHGQNVDLKSGTRRRIPTSSSYIKAGEVALLSYPFTLTGSAARRYGVNLFTMPAPGKKVEKVTGADAEYRLVFIVNTGGTKTDGVFLSSAGNLLLSCFKLSQSEVVNKVILKAFYKKRRVQYQHFVGALSTILGAEAFRTYNLKLTHDLQILQLKIRNIPDDE